MTDTQHTPGPWAIEPDALGEYSIVTDNGGTIADIYGRNPANARLIAAAPDLLAALERLVTLMHIVGDEPFRNGVTDSTGSIDEGVVIASDWLHDARAAIAEATGQAD